MLLDTLSGLAGFVAAYPWLVALIVVIAAPYWLAPITLKFTSKASAHPSFEPFDRTAEREPPPVTAYFATVEESLDAEGFVMTVDLVQHGFMSNMVNRVRFFENAANDECAIAAATYTSAGELGMLVTRVEFSTDFRDGGSLQTNNSATLGVFARRAGHVTEHFPTVTDAAQLCRIHRALVRRRRVASAATVARCVYRGNPAHALAKAMTREMDAQIGTGYYWLDTSIRAYRPTWKGAALMCWKMLPPMKTIRLRRAARRAERLLQELGVDIGTATPARKRAEAA